MKMTHILNRIAFIALLSLVCIFPPGCATQPTTLDPNHQTAQVKIDPAVLQKDVRVVARSGARAGLQADKNARAYLEAVYGMIQGLVSDQNYNPNALRDGLANISVKELRDPIVAQGIADAVEIVENHIPALTAQFGANSPIILSILGGMRDGIGDALGYPIHP